MNVQEIDVRQLAEKLAARQPVCLVDVRQPWEHDVAALPGSVLIPLDELPARVAEVHGSDSELIVVYCHHGIRSLHGAAYLARAGLTNVVSLAGGIDAWSLAVDANVPRY